MSYWYVAFYSEVVEFSGATVEEARAKAQAFMDKWV